MLYKKFIIPIIMLTIVGINNTNAQIIIDGTSSEPNYSTLATYTSGLDGFGPGNNIYEINYYADGSYIYVGIPADLNDNNNIILWFNFSDYTGNPVGEVVGKADAQSVFGSSGLVGAKLDFEVDYAFAFNEGFGTSNIYVDAAKYNDTGIIASGYLGTTDQSGTFANLPLNDIPGLFDANALQLAYNNGGGGSGGSKRGIEIRLDISKIVGVDSTHTVQLFAAIFSSGGNSSK